MTKKADYATMTRAIDALNEGYDPQFPHPHDHIYTKKVVQGIFAAVYQNAGDEAYAKSCPDRWQGELKKIGENVFLTCEVCGKTEEHVLHLTNMYKTLTCSRIINDRN